jgi:hypothetical protein
MDLSSDPFDLPPLPPPPLSPNLGTSDAIVVDTPDLPTSDTTTPAVSLPVLLSSDPSLTNNPFSPAGLSASSHRPLGYNKKRGYPPAHTPAGRFDKAPRLSSTPKTARDAILQARDLLIQACSLASSHEEQSKLLDLLEVFREYTEKGRLQTAATIIASQVANLESATRQIENKARALAKAPVPSVPNKPSTLRQSPPGNGPPGPTGPTGTTGTPPAGTLFGTPSSSYASIAGNSQEWTLVKPKAKLLKPERTGKPHRLILVRSVAIPPDFSSLTLRNAFNKAFEEKGVKGPVVNTVTKSLGHNLVVSTTSQFSADYLLENQPI